MRRTWRWSCSGLLLASSVQLAPGPAGVVIERAKESRPATSPLEQLELATWNIWGLPDELTGRGPERYAEIAAAIERSGCDVIGLQEVWTDEARAAVLGLDGWHRASEELDLAWLSQCGLVTLSRWPVRRAFVRRFEVCASYDALVSKGALFTAIEVLSLGELHVWNVHLQSGTGGDIEAARARQLEQLARWVRETSSPRIPCVVLGDFNCVAGAEPRRAQKLLGCDLELRQGTPRPTWDPSSNCWAREEQPMAIDRILLNESFVARWEFGTALAFAEAGPDGTPLSDHYGLRARLFLPSRAPHSSAFALLAKFTAAWKMPPWGTRTLAAR
ncbi:MAG: endonuclease/exonuclease/phosphatase family protein [Planctomycetes bacterium]|nr:endonuclease/exonuclease/phosphatase family protein [Planctomycetota bacterium]